MSVAQHCPVTILARRSDMVDYTAPSKQFEHLRLCFISFATRCWITVSASDAVQMESKSLAGRVWQGSP
eukprot:5667173-Amphidinium_carterae.1